MGKCPPLPFRGTRARGLPRELWVCLLLLGVDQSIELTLVFTEKQQTLGKNILVVSVVTAECNEFPNLESVENCKYHSIPCLQNKLLSATVPPAILG